MCLFTEIPSVLCDDTHSDQQLQLAIKDDCN